MLVIPDANSIISALIKRGRTLELFEWNDFSKEIKFVAPENLSIEVRRNIPSIVKKTGLLESEIVELLDKIESQIEFIPAFKFEGFLTQAIKISPPNDFPYIALALLLKSEGKDPTILSNDKGLLNSLSITNVRGVSMHDLLFKLKLI